jgi:hypothetical protein
VSHRRRELQITKVYPQSRLNTFVNAGRRETVLDDVLWQQAPELELFIAILLEVNVDEGQMEVG